MTKKSAGRLARDAKAKAMLETAAANAKQLENNTCWDDLVVIYNDCVRLLHTHGLLSQKAHDAELLAEVSDKATLVTNIRLLAGDLKMMSEELRALHALHADKSGGSQDIDEVMTSIGLAEQYNLWMTKHDQVVMPTVYHIIEQFNQAEGRIAARKAEQAAADAATNVNVVTDVPVKMVSTD